MQPNIYYFNDHKILIKKIDTQAYYVIKKLRQNGFIAYLVGGSVRDLLLRQIPKDFDVSTSAKPEEIRRIFKNSLLIGKRFRLAHVRFGKKIIEVSTFRSGDTSTEELITNDNDWGDAEQDALRRDFTINGLFYDPEEQAIIDYVNGFEDAKNQVLRSIGTSKIRFIQDPVRMIRLLKFKARFDLNIEKETLNALKTCKEEITKSSPARILEELLKMLESGFASNFFHLLVKYNFIQILLPIINDYPYKQKIYTLLDKADDYNIKNRFNFLDRSLLLSCILFPILERELKTISHDQNVHLGFVAEKTKQLINNIFLPLFHLPRKTKVIMISILVNQFRFTPILKKNHSKKHMSKDPYIDFAIKFFGIRSQVDPKLLKSYTTWHEIYINAHNRHKK